MPVDRWGRIQEWLTHHDKVKVKKRPSSHPETLMARDNLYQKIYERINIKKKKILWKEHHKKRTGRGQRMNESEARTWGVGPLRHVLSFFSWSENIRCHPVGPVWSDNFFWTSKKITGCSSWGLHGPASTKQTWVTDSWPGTLFSVTRQATCTFLISMKKLHTAFISYWHNKFTDSHIWQTSFTDLQVPLEVFFVCFGYAKNPLEMCLFWNYPWDFL